MLEKPTAKKPASTFGNVMWRNEAADILTQARIQEIQREIAARAGFQLNGAPVRGRDQVFRTQARAVDQPADQVVVFDDLNEDNR